MTRKFGENLGEYFHEVFSDRFFVRALNYKAEVQEDLEEQYDKFFDEMASMVGGEGRPKVLQTSWPRITQGWADRKGTPGANRFYHGITEAGESYRSELKAMETEEAFGPIETSVGTVTAQGAFGKGSNRRTFKADRSKLSTAGNILRYGGSFASIDNFFNAKLGFKAFSKVTSLSNLLRGFEEGSHLAIVTGVNEGIYSTSKGHSVTRPFLMPMVEYYTDVKLPEIFKKSVNSR